MKGVLADTRASIAVSLSGKMLPTDEGLIAATQYRAGWNVTLRGYTGLKQTKSLQNPGPCGLCSSGVAPSFLS